ncbi:calcium-binding protein P-like isoform X1 [Hypomesus transpacificus]|uniref:calcium-binding protein P-like isoform X1 n=1 Tax=Hypomesus transpacificus TaxID=137520 RepID=UPI001F07F661|nr:calcium-binding protein P-like isoform X1 [Hypomesus transpacificus]
MIRLAILAYLATTVTAVPAQVTGGPALSQPKQRGDLPAQKDPSVQASATKPGPQVVVQIHPSVQQPQPILPQQQDAQGGGQFLFPFQPHAWGPQLMMPFHPNTQSPAQPGPQPQQPQYVFPYGYFPAFSPQQGNQLFSPYGMPVFFQPPVYPNFPAPTGPVETVLPPSQPEAPAQNPLPEEQPQQTPQFVWIPQPRDPLFGGLSSEELEMVDRMGQIGLFMPNVQGTSVAKTQARQVAPASLPTGTMAINPGLRSFGLPSPAFIPTMEVSHGGLPTGQATYPEITIGEVPLPDPQALPVGQEAAIFPAVVEPNYQSVEPTATYSGISPPRIESKVYLLPETTPTAGFAVETNTDLYP